MNSRTIFILALLLIAAVTVRAELTVTSLKADYKTNPMGIDNPAPKLSWIIQSDEPNTMQDGYEIRAAMGIRDLAERQKSAMDNRTGELLSKYSCEIWRPAPWFLSTHILADQDCG